jgi:hypothetical protein
MKRAWIDPVNTVRDVCPGEPAELYHPDVAALYSTEVPDDVVPGAVNVNGAWVNPTSPAPVEPAPSYPVLTPLQFKMCFSALERIAGKELAKTDPIMADAYSILDDPRLTSVDLGLQSNRDLLAYMVSKGVITEARMAEILTGKQL